MRILYVTDGPSSPGSRFRCLQFFPHLARAGIDCDVRFAYDERYNDTFEKPWAPAYKLAGRLKRIASLLSGRGYDALFLHKTAFAFSSFPEQLRALLGRTPIVFDFDDAIYLGVGGAENRLRERTFRGVVESAEVVIAGNEHLAERAQSLEKTVVIPSVVDTDLYVPRPHRDGPELVVGWIGTASNFPFLRAVLPGVLAALAKVPRARLRVVSNGLLPEYERHPQVEQWRWSEAMELKSIQSFDIGLMPLLDTEQSRGKCGFKMIQYMACGVPFISSAVGANVSIGSGEGGGLLISDPAEWAPALSRLASDSDLRARLGAQGRARAESRYSVRSVIPKYLEVFERLIDGRSHRRDRDALGPRRTGTDVSDAPAPE